MNPINLFHNPALDGDDLDLDLEMEDYSLVEDYREIPQLQPIYARQPLWKHQSQMIHMMASAEYNPPVVDSDGNTYYSRFGILCASTGVGKTNIALGISCYDTPNNYYADIPITNSLHTFVFKKKEVPTLNCTVICTKESIINSVWEKNIRQFYDNRLTYFKIDSLSNFDKDVKKHPDYIRESKDASDLDDYVFALSRLYEANQMDELQVKAALTSVGIEDVEVSDNFHRDVTNKIKSKLNDFYLELKKQTLVNIMSSHKILLIGSGCIHILFDIMKEYKIGRFIFDEPQNTVITNQRNFQGNGTDTFSFKIRNMFDEKCLAYENPFGFLWYISATPSLIRDNDTNHHFNNWVGLNNVILNDYLLGKGNHKFLDMIKRYVIKLPYQYCLESNTLLSSLKREFVIKCKASTITGILHGAFGDDFDELLENDDYEGFIKKLNSSDSGNIFEASRARLEADIDEQEHNIQNYRAGTNNTIIANATKKLEEMKRKLKSINEKIDLLMNKIGENPEDCIICYEAMDINGHPGMLDSERCVLHGKGNCNRIFHVKCLFDVFKYNPNGLCPNCRQKLEPSDIFMTSEIANITKNKPKKVVSNDFDPENIYSSKKEALRLILGSTLDRDGRSYQRMKVLLFIQGTTILNEIIEICRSAGYNVRLPFRVASSKKELDRMYPTADNGTIVVQGPKLKDLHKHITEFQYVDKPYVWISRSIKDSAGLNFPFVDTLIMYSDFPSKMQILGRCARMDRTTPYDFFVLKNEVNN